MRPFAMVCLLLAACSGHDARPLVVTESDNGKPISLASNGEFLLHLVSNPTTGFRWQWQPELPAAISCKELPFASSNSDSGIVGAPGEQQWLCRVAAAGSYTIALDYRRSWEKVPAARRFSLTLQVR